MSEQNNVTAPVSPETAAPSAEAPASTTEKPARKSMGSTRQELRAKLNGVANNIFEKAKPSSAATTSKPEAEQSGTQPPTETAAEAVAALEEATGQEAPEQKPNETAKQYETRISKLLLESSRAKADALKHKEAREAVEKERDELRAKLEEASKDPVKALKLANMTPDQLAQLMIDGKLTKAEETAVKADLPDEVKELIEEAKRLKAEKAEQERQTEAAKVRTENLKLVDQARLSHAQDFPVLAVMNNEYILNVYESKVEELGGKEPNFTEVAKELQDGVINGVSGYLSDAGFLKFFLSQKPELKDAVVKALGLDRPAAAPAPTPAPTEEEKPVRTITNAKTAEVPSRGKTKLTEAERKARMAARAADIFGK